MVLPKDLRPQGLQSKTLVAGIHLPAGFIEDVRAIDESLFFVYHPYRIQYDELTNMYTGSLDDPRWQISEKYGREVWGWVMTDNSGAPIPDGTWHIWCLKKDFGYSHVSNIASTDPVYLRRIVTRLGKEKIYKAKYGPFAWNRKMRQDEEERQAKLQDQKDQEYLDITKENDWLLRKAAENLERGVTAPSNPTKEIISSYAGQTNRSKIVRPITDKEGGLYLPD